MFSLIHAILDRPLQDVLAELPLSADVRAALLGQPNRLRTVLDTTIAYERGDWEALSLAAKRLDVPEHRLVPLLVEAVDWAGSVTGA
jgi:EAL and modified HD-GYP domain-containing signal transduction protein